MSRFVLPQTCREVAWKCPFLHSRNITLRIPPVNQKGYKKWYVPSGKHILNYGKPSFYMEKPSFSLWKTIILLWVTKSTYTWHYISQLCCSYQRKLWPICRWIIYLLNKSCPEQTVQTFSDVSTKTMVKSSFGYGSKHNCTPLVHIPTLWIVNSLWIGMFTYPMTWW